MPGDVQIPPPTGAVQWIAKCQSLGTGDDQFNGICSTSDGGIVAAGYYTSSGTLTAVNANGTDFITILPASNTGTDPFIVKYSSVGVVQWIAKCKSSSTGNDMFKAICSTSDGGIVAAGSHNATSNTLTAVNADGTTDFTTLLPASSTGQDPFLVKYRSDGVVQWIAKCKSSTTDADDFTGICSTSDGGLVASGTYSGFSSGNFTAVNANGTNFGTVLPAANGIDPFLVKYSSAGAVQWIANNNAGSNDHLNDFFTAICSTSDGVVAAGSYNSTGTLTAYNANRTNFGTTLGATGTGQDPFLVKYSSSGTVQWIAKCQSLGTGDDRFNAICSTSDSGIVAAGFYISSSGFTLTAVNANGTNFLTVLPASNTGTDPFLVKYSSAGVVQWIAKNQSSSTATDQFNAICSTSDGGVVAAGFYNTTATLTAVNSNGSNFGTLLSPASSTGHDPFLVKYSSAGTVQWIAKCLSSSTGDDRFNAICSTTDGGIVAAGYYTSSGTLSAVNADGTTFLTLLSPASSTGNDPFLVKFY